MASDRNESHQCIVHRPKTSARRNAAAWRLKDALEILRMAIEGLGEGVSRFPRHFLSTRVQREPSRSEVRNTGSFFVDVVVPSRA